MLTTTFSVFWHTILPFLSLFGILLALFIVLYNRYSLQKIMNNLHHMLDSAIEGNFMEETFDESLFSSVESKLFHYLRASQTAMQKSLEERNHIKELISDISHQTKTPLSNLMLYTELLTEVSSKKEPDNESRQYLEALHIQTKKLHFLIDSLIKISRLETGILSLHPEASPLMPMLTTLYNQFAKKAEEKGLSLKLLPTTASACLDEKWTLEALGNLVDNAIKYTPSGSVTIQVITYELFVCIEVTDTGIGILVEEQTKIFSRFYRSARVSQEQGVGIGLYLARQIITGQGGYIKLSSIPDKGSSFRIYLPKTL